jgi:hypothetical protein
VIQPLTPENAYARSLSAQFGLSALPFHVELSHRPKPCRYVLLGCLEPGEAVTATRLINWRGLGFAPDELAMLEGAPILVRSGRRSFYSTLLSRDDNFLRYDPGCIEAIDKRGEAAVQVVAQHLERATPYEHSWARGEMLLIDNWATLHGRGPAVAGADRKLARILIDA